MCTKEGKRCGMNAIPFDVNDSKLRETFFDRLFADCIAGLAENAPPLWGKMTPQQMIEHLVWAFECSTGTIELPCRPPENLLDRAKRFLLDNRQTPHEFKNPLLGENAPPLRFAGFGDAKAALSKELARFVDHFREEPDAIHVHPIFGPLGAEEWQRSQFKHCYHHLLQFGLISQPGDVPS
jgi:oxepin-CoA hydrolase / 3-oxo-5,6-dehydrosuberyl-CoA semialdehyde dehydrogenase